MAVPEALTTVIMPAHSDSRDAEDARLVADTFGLPVMTVDFSRSFDALLLQLQQATGTWPPGAQAGDDRHAPLAKANLKPRLRMTALYYLANRLNCIVAGTGNRCEIAIGYYTKYGDGGVDVLPIGALLKSEVRQLARQLGVPASIVDKAPSAGLWLGQTDEGEMGFWYADSEEYLRKGPDSLTPATVMKIERLAASARQAAHAAGIRPGGSVSGPPAGGGEAPKAPCGLCLE